MLKQYNVLTRCLIAINSPALPHIEKLKLEIQLILMKQLLLMNPVELMLRGVAESETEFEAILKEIQSICLSSGSSDTAARLTAVTAQIKSLTGKIKLHCATEKALDLHSMQTTDADKQRLWN